ncbi:OTU-domain-containing protein [Sodiomyces alkalinus F11]|uniref:Ubiquitin thioesterase OTU n=1 Tax=Sodiomyces alkalinus (strain CBS 110278 / VKM F-3762 / F11) TaxID=1314773 RepID=A0A3N2PTR5_SODAK|nr:OTU-domain-containing protein [Sodiomyces alkalinus F11]ROT37888.1 OTU-domain-containing protein [Sodiomyces alkalinus F11]
MRARYKGPAGTGVLSLDDAATVAQIFDEIRAKSGIGDFTLKYGWPLKTLDASHKAESAKSLGLNGETFTIVPNETTAPPAAEAPASSASLSGLSLKRDTSSFLSAPTPPTKGPEGVSIPWPDRQGTLLLRVMPDDNSCLFTAFGGALPRQLPAPELRKMVADYILAHPAEYNAAVLAMPPHDYARAIQGRDRWGGAIELAIFSDLFDVEICTFDVKGQTLLPFGENKATRCLLVYSGIHYDRVALSPSEPPYTHSDLPPELDQTMWPTDDDEVLAVTQQLVAELNKMHYYTDPSEILLRCEAPGCDWMGSGERAGRLHAEQTGHASLSEIEDNALLKCNAPGCDWLGSGEREAKKHTSDMGHSSLSVIPDF